MADTVTSNVIATGPRNHSVVLTCISDGSGESNVSKIDVSGLKIGDGSTASHITIDAIEWNIQGFTYIKLAWDHTTDDTALVLSGTGDMCFKKCGGLRDPGSAGGTGDLLLTSVGAGSGDTYTIVLHVSLS